MTIREKIANAIAIFRGSQIKRRGIAMSKDRDEEFSYVLIDDLIDLVAEVESKLGLFSFMSLDGQVATLTVYDRDSEEEFMLHKRLPEKVFMLLSEKNLTVEYLSLESRVMRSMYRNLYKITGLVEGEEEKESFLAEDVMADYEEEKPSEGAKEEIKEDKKEEMAKDEEEKVSEEAEPKNSSISPKELLAKAMDEEEPETKVEEIVSDSEEKQEEEEEAEDQMKEALTQNLEFNLENLLYDNTVRDEDIEVENMPGKDLAKDEEEEDLEDEEELELQADRLKMEEEISEKISNFINSWSANEEVGLRLYESIMTKLFNEPYAILDSKLKEVPDLLLEKVSKDVDKVLEKVEEEISPLPND